MEERRIRRVPYMWYTGKEEWDKSTLERRKEACDSHGAPIIGHVQRIRYMIRMSFLMALTMHGYQ